MMLKLIHEVRTSLQVNNNPPRKRKKGKITLPTNVQAMPKLEKIQRMLPKREEVIDEHVNPV